MPGTFNRTVVVTGASRGLGLEWVKQLSRDPKTLVIAVARNVEKATLLQPLLSESVVSVQADLSDLNSFTAVVSEISKVTDNKVDVIINNAAMMTGAGARRDVGISKSTPEEWQQEFNVNVVSPVFFTTALLPLLRNGREKKVVNISSFLGDIVWNLSNSDMHFASYAVTKAAITLATTKFHVEFKDEGFIFLALNPGWVGTDMGGESAPLTPESSTRQMLNFVNRSTPADSGKFFSLDGQEKAVRS